MRLKFLTLCLATLGMCGTAWGLSATMTAAPSSATAPPNSFVTIEVLVSSSDQIGAVQCTVEYNSSTTTFVNAQLGSAVSSGFSLANVFENVSSGFSTPGTNASVLLQIIGSGLNYFTGSDQVVAVLTFQMSASNCQQTALGFSTACQLTHLSTVQLQTICNPTIVQSQLETDCTSDVPKQPALFTLSQNSPNPFNPSTTIGFELLSEGLVRLDVFDVAGRQVRQLADRVYPSGAHRVNWDGRDDSGETLSAGVYFYRLNVDGVEATRRAMLVK